LFGFFDAVAKLFRFISSLYSKVMNYLKGNLSEPAYIVIFVILYPLVGLSLWYFLSYLFGGKKEPVVPDSRVGSIVPPPVVDSTPAVPVVEHSWGVWDLFYHSYSSLFFLLVLLIPFSVYMFFVVGSIGFLPFFYTICKFGTS